MRKAKKCEHPLRTINWFKHPILNGDEVLYLGTCKECGHRMLEIYHYVETVPITKKRAREMMKGSCGQ